VIPAKRDGGRNGRGEWKRKGVTGKERGEKGKRNALFPSLFLQTFPSCAIAREQVFPSRSDVCVPHVRKGSGIRKFRRDGIPHMRNATRNATRALRLLESSSPDLATLNRVPFSRLSAPPPSPFLPGTFCRQLIRPDLSRRNYNRGCRATLIALSSRGSPGISGAIYSHGRSSIARGGS